MNLRRLQLLMITLLLVLCSGLMLGQTQTPAASTVTVYVFQDTSATDGILSGYADTLTFGTDAAATLCLDSGLETELPPAPPSGVFDVRFTDEYVDAPCMGQGSMTNYQPYLGAGTTNEYGFTLKNGDGTVKSMILKWNKCSLTNATSVIVTNDVGQQADMVAADSIVFTRTQFLNKYLYFRADFTGITGCPTGVNEVSSSIPEHFALNQNYPNPFNPSTTIKFAVAKAAFTDIAVYDMLGRRISTLASEELNPGTYSVIWNGTDNSGATVASGVYYVRMAANNADGVNFAQVQKLLLMK